MEDSQANWEFRHEQQDSKPYFGRACGLHAMLLHASSSDLAASWRCKADDEDDIKGDKSKTGKLTCRPGTSEMRFHGKGWPLKSINRSPVAQ